MGRVLSVLLFVLIGIVAGQVLAQEHPSHGPISIRSQNPLYLLFLAPRPERARVLKHGELRLAARGPYSNIFEQGSSAVSGVTLDLDMELFRPSFLLEWGFLPGWEFGIEVPFIHFYGGFLDGFIQAFHRTFGAPNSGRDRVENDRFSYRVSQGGQALYATTSQVVQPSDLVFHVKRHLLEEDSHWPALTGTLYIKVPTGNSGRGLGSGAPDIGFNFAAEKNYRRIHGFANLGGVLLGSTDLALDPFLNPFVWSWMLGLEVTAWSHHLSIIGQLQGDGSLFDGTGLQSLDQGNLMLTIGFAGQEGPWGWKVAFAEDPSGQGPTVDFSAYFEVSYTWDL